MEVVRLVARGTIEEQMYARQVYKVQLKKQTLGGNAEGKNQPHIFKGVDRDENRKGELFGLENLLKFRDGSFMQLLVSSFLKRGHILIEMVVIHHQEMFTRVFMCLFITVEKSRQPK